MLKMKTIVIGIQTESSIGNFSVLPSAEEKSLKKKIITLEIIAKNTKDQLSLNLAPKVKTELNNTMLNRKKGKAKDLCNLTCIAFVE